MELQSLREQILHTDNAFSVVLADSRKQVEAACRLRYQVYCLERGFEPGRDGVETDQFDSRARHVLLVHRASGEPIGTVRVIPSSFADGLHDLPMTAVCAPGLLRNLPALTTGEISRFAVSKQRRMTCQAGAMVRLGLMRGILRLSHEMGLTHWCAIMEPTLIRLLQMSSIHFSPLGPLVEYHGLRQPACLNIAAVLDLARFERPDAWNYVTLGGTLSQRDQVPARLAA
ncbi:MAG TPA: GNAT family N-acyltransferase [Acetobacteraceae bacterium]|nr:GNAT family N-acyltransferase [Acetobacteraceae bacterium]